MHILIDGLPPRFSSDILIDLLRPCGTVVSAEIFTDEQGASLGVASVVMSEAEEAEQVRLTLAGREFDGLPIMIDINDPGQRSLPPALQTLQSLLKFRKEHLSAIDDRVIHESFNSAIEQL